MPLYDYSRYMEGHLGCERKDVRYTMGRFCMFYNLYEEHELDLAKTIDKIFSEKRDSKLSE